MEFRLVQIREQQRESWNKFSPGWKKWDNLFMEFLKPTGDEIIRLLNPKYNDVVLDVASGTGEPGLTIASKLNGRGRVIISDLSEKMLEIALENARLRGINNVETRACDVCELPFDAKTFAAISCRFGFMFFPDMLLAAKEMVRVLKPRGAIATSVWNVPEKNFWITAIMETINKYMDLPKVPGSPGMFRCAKEGLMSDLFRQAGLKNISVKEVTGKLNCKTADVYWNVMNDLAAPVVAALSKADDKMKEKIRKEVFQAVQTKFDDGNVIIDSSALIIYGEK
jgi:ubiquinone/menaquinone biosynthesis C-methylase UbiE